MNRTYAIQDEPRIYVQNAQLTTDTGQVIPPTWICHWKAANAGW
jgi:hypothetical protein